jgi:hypothetical protein
LLSGQINSLVGLARALRARGHQVRVVTAFAEDQLFDPEHVYDIASSPGSLFAKIPRIGPVAQQLCNATRDADVIQVNLPTPSFTILADVLQSLIGRV